MFYSNTDLFFLYLSRTSYFSRLYPCGLCSVAHVLSALTKDGLHPLRWGWDSASSEGAYISLGSVHQWRKNWCKILRRLVQLPQYCGHCPGLLWWRGSWERMFSGHVQLVGGETLEKTLERLHILAGLGNPWSATRKLEDGCNKKKKKRCLDIPAETAASVTGLRNKQKFTDL